MRTPMNTFYNMKSRCYNVKDKKYKFYGGKGITICPQWLKSPQSFVAWANTHGFAPGMQIHRKKNTDGYSPENCEFVSKTKHIEAYCPQQLSANAVTCERCGHSWNPRVSGRPVSCPKCKSYEWEKKK